MSTKINSMRGGFLGRALAVFGAAANASAAVESGRKPAKRDWLRSVSIRTRSSASDLSAFAARASGLQPRMGVTPPLIAQLAARAA